MYCSKADDKIFQSKPPFSKPSQFKLKSWTETIEGYLYEAKRLTLCILLNRRLMNRRYTWFVTIYFWQVMSPKEAAALWGKVCTALRRKGIVALWVREPTRKNKIHYHLLVSSRQSKAELETTIIAAMPSRKETPWHKNIKPVDDRWWLAYYITKAKKSGMFRGKVVPDKYMTKRLLFKPNTKLHKHGEIGKFWLKPTKALWKSIQEREAKIEKGLADGRVGRLARYAFELINGEVPLKTIERNFGYFADTAGIQDWLAVISDGEAVPA